MCHKKLRFQHFEMVWITTFDAKKFVEMVWIVAVDAKILVWITIVDCSREIMVWIVIVDDRFLVWIIIVERMNYSCWWQYEFWVGPVWVCINLIWIS